MACVFFAAVLFFVAANAQVFHKEDGTKYWLGAACDAAWYRIKAQKTTSEFTNIVNTTSFNCFHITQTTNDPWHVHTESDDIFRVFRGKGFLRTDDATTGYVANSIDSVTILNKGVKHAFYNRNIDYSCIWACYAPQFVSAPATGRPAISPSSALINSLTNTRTEGNFGVFSEVGRNSAADLNNAPASCTESIPLAATDAITVVVRNSCQFQSSLVYSHEQDIVITVLSNSIIVAHGDYVSLLNTGDVIALSNNTEYVLTSTGEEAQLLFFYSPSPDGNYEGSFHFSSASALSFLPALAGLVLLNLW
jgi:mannose-6-phosphate isomerase-like protein (cupin superfamily)